MWAMTAGSTFHVRMTCCSAVRKERLQPSRAPRADTRDLDCHDRYRDDERTGEHNLHRAPT
jgi:hypothetical protein